LKRVAVTGLGGFTGVYVKEDLEQRGYEVVSVGANLLDASALAGELCALEADAIIHLAAISFPAHDDYREIYDVNLHGSVNLFRAIKQSKTIKKTILASSSNVYGSVGGLLDESVCPKPVNHYGMSKLAMEYASAIEGVECIIARCFNYSGVGQLEHFLLPKIISHFKAEKKVIELGNIDVYRDFSDVRFVAGVYASLVESDIKSGVFNICSGKALSLRYIVETLENLSGHKIEIKINEKFVRAGEIETISGSDAKLRASIKGLQKPIPLEETLKWMLRER